jgi:hypothetical protein
MEMELENFLTWLAYRVERDLMEAQHELLKKQGRAQ